MNSVNGMDMLLITSLKDQSLRKLIFNDLSNIKEDIIFKDKLEE